MQRQAVPAGTAGFLPFLRRHDPDQVQGSARRFLSPVRGSPRNARRIGARLQAVKRAAGLQTLQDAPRSLRWAVISWTETRCRCSMN